MGSPVEQVLEHLQEITTKMVRCLGNGTDNKNRMYIRCALAGPGKEHALIHKGPQSLQASWCQGSIIHGQMSEAI